MAGRDRSERVVAIVGMRIKAKLKPAMIRDTFMTPFGKAKPKAKQL
jgi:hypothetical protein